MKKGLMFKGKFCPVWGGLYCATGDNPSFHHGGIEGLSRAIKAEMHDAAVVVEYEEEREDRDNV